MSAGLDAAGTAAEAIARVEALEARVAALSSALTAVFAAADMPPPACLAPAPAPARARHLSVVHGS